MNEAKTSGLDSRPSESATNDSRWRFANLFWIASRLVLGGTFLYLGWVKVADPVTFLKLVRQFEVFENPLALNLIAAWLPWLELFCGALLIAGLWQRGTGLVVLVLLTGFTGLILNRALNISAGGTAFCSIYFDCGCGGGEVWICGKLAQNIGLMALAAALGVKGPAKSS